MNVRLYTYTVLAAAAVLSACGGSSEKKSSGGEAEQSRALPPPNYGKIKEVAVGEGIDPAMAERGGKIFGVTCSACHKMDERYVGPPLGDVAVRRTPVYIMNMILDTETMIEKDDTARCLLQEYLTRMPNTNIDEKDARDVLEHLRDAAAKRRL